VLNHLPAQNSFDKDLKDVDKNKLLTKGIACDLSSVASDEGLLSRIRRKLAQIEKGCIITDRALID
jgi:hypothetical protein